jgi:hypothetical protein
VLNNINENSLFWTKELFKIPITQQSKIFLDEINSSIENFISNPNHLLILDFHAQKK